MADDNLRDRVTRQGEEVIGRLAQELLDNPIVSGALSRAFDTRERAMRAQELAMGALNLPSAGDLERLTRRVRSVSLRLESIEDGLDRLEGRLSRGAGAESSAEQRLDERLQKIETLLERLESERATPASATASSARSAPASRARSAPASRARSAPASRARSGSGQAKAAKRPASAPRTRPKRSGPAAG